MISRPIYPGAQHLPTVGPLTPAHTPARTGGAGFPNKLAPGSVNEAFLTFLEGEAKNASEGYRSAVLTAYEALKHQVLDLSLPPKPGMSSARYSIKVRDKNQNPLGVMTFDLEQGTGADKAFELSKAKIELSGSPVVNFSRGANGTFQKSLASDEQEQPQSTAKAIKYPQAPYSDGVEARSQLTEAIKRVNMNTAG